MAFKSHHITLVASTSTALLVKGNGSGTTFKNVVGHVADPIPVQVRNEDSTLTCYIGGPDVSASNGRSLAPGEIFTANLYGEEEIPYVFSTGTAILSVLCGRQ